MAMKENGIKKNAKRQKVGLEKYLNKIHFQNDASNMAL